MRLWISDLSFEHVALFCFVFFFQIWFYTNDIFRNAGITESFIQYTTVGTGAIEVISGTLGVSFTFHFLDFPVVMTYWSIILGLFRVVPIMNEMNRSWE